jgi:Protein of unknown function (DUF1393).
MVQIILAIIIIALGIFIFKVYPIKRVQTKDIVIAAIFVMVELVCKRFLTIMIPLFGAESLKVGFEYLPLMIAGYFLSPSYAFLIGLCCDFIGLILVPTGFPFFGFTLVTILVAVIPSLIKENVKTLSENKLRYFVEGFMGVLLIGAISYIMFLENIKINDTIYTLTNSNKIILISICCLILIAFVILIEVLKKKINDEEAKEFSTWILCVTLVEVICTLCLTPLWLDIMYSIPYVVSLCIRVVKECAVLPLEVFIGYSIIKLMKRVIIKTN